MPMFPKDRKIPQRIEGVFGSIGLGNTDAERIVEIIEAYERSLSLAEELGKRKKNKKGKKFEEILSESTEKAPEEEES